MKPSTLHLACFVALLCATKTLPQEEVREYVGNLKPKEALAAFETEPGFTVELVAAEPLTIDPVAIAFDERGRLFVAENRDYPTGSPGGRPLGVIALLEDRDGDSRMDHRAEFATGIAFPNGVMAWREGVIVTAAPDVWWLADLDGDGHAEVKELLLTGFDASSTSQLRANDPTLGPDGWVYIAGGLRGGKVHSPKRPEVVLDLAKGDLRFNPDTGQMELTEGKSQYGLAFDDAANRFACMNRVQVQHAPLPRRYLARNPLLTPPGVLHNCPDIIDNTLAARATGGAARYYPISANVTTADSHVGTYSAACAVHIYRGTQLPREYRGAAFSCDPTGNLVRADRLEKTGGTFAARRIHEQTEALRSRDNWFRPVFIADGPDGALYIADMYRKVIEHPQYLPEEVRKHTDFASGNDKGRIWRLRGPAKLPPRANPVSEAGLKELVALLDSSIPWERDTALRLLIERKDKSLAPLIRERFLQTTEEGPAVWQLHLLDRFGALGEPILEHGLRHPEPGVRQNALRLSETFFADSPKLRQLALRCATDPDPHVRFQAALSLGQIADAKIVPALARIAEKQADDPWTRAAIQTALPRKESLLDLVKELSARKDPPSEGLLALLEEIGRQLGLSKRPGDTLEELRVATAQTAPAIQMAALTGFLDARGATPPPALAHLFPAARTELRHENSRSIRRVQSIRLLAHDDSPETTTLLRARLVPTEPGDIQAAAARALLSSGNVQTAAELLTRESWAGYAPGLRNVLLNLLTAREEFAGVLLDAIEHRAVPAGVLTPAQRNSLRRSKNPAIKTRAEKLLTSIGGDRNAAFEAAKSVLELKPRPANGRAVFQTHCATCHRLDQAGVAVGPDLFDIRNQSKESLLYHIVIPEAEIAPNFVSYECETTDGRLISGLLASESPASITLRMAQGLEEIIPRDRIRKLTASALSLMPQEMEKTMTPQELADLLAYLRGEQ